MTHSVLQSHKQTKKKLDDLQTEQPQQTKTSHENGEQQQFNAGVKNLTSIKFTKEETQLINYRLQYSTKMSLTPYISDLTVETAKAIQLLDIKQQNPYRIIASGKLKQIIDKGDNYNIAQ